VEITEQDSSGAFVPRETVTDAAFAHAVAVAAVGSRQFYLADDVSASGVLARWWSALRKMRASTILFHDGKQTRVAARDLGAPAGIGLSPDGSHLFVTDALDRQLHVYRRDAGSNELVAEESVPLGSTPGQLDVDADGVVWIAAHPRLFEFASHRRDPARPAATQLLRFDPRARKPAPGESDARVSQVYGNDGSQLSAGSIAAHWHDEFLVGAPLDHKVLICKSNP
jgi:arylesterase/paraoxonase